MWLYFCILIGTVQKTDSFLPAPWLSYLGTKAAGIYHSTQTKIALYSIAIEWMRANKLTTSKDIPHDSCNFNSADIRLQECISKVFKLHYGEEFLNIVN